ncbi:response regulator transcription factor [Saccharibacillus kuerlensis]|uniref:DNA-binding response regulator n=1 Tax=Saccharibacillus kuerlensis TaxID=459527 RepID=A0ABQ2L7F9_9BACL|nr:response regulator [Saccharibacillus kuerlensis]GGO06010.1 DNA-binding response regulator [Saccharibacillus kuerlensis]
MYKLLIADDEAEIRHGLGNYFPWGELGFEVDGFAQNGLEALEYIGCHSVDVLLCDVMMPVMTGIEVAKYLHKQKSPTRIIFLSAHRDFDAACRAMEFGVRSYILKPTRYQELKDIFTTLKETMDRELKSGAAEEPVRENGPVFPLREGAADPIIMRIVRYIEENCPEATLEGSALTVRMNPTYVSKYFKQKTGINFSEYLNDVRMLRAAGMLEQGDCRTYEVSEAVGYQNPKNFTRSFKRRFGKTPREFRQDLSLELKR